MCLVNIIMNEDAAHSCVHKLGATGAVQFQDLNPSLTPFQRRYVASVKRCDEMERILRYFDGVRSPSAV
jgi:V-type H+-transporting ATPase subunit a